jgi:LEA14-like dessication related protein
MKKGWIIAIIGFVIVALVAVIVQAKIWIKKVRYGVAPGFKLLRIGVQEIRVLFPIYIYNPTPFKVIASDLNLNIYFDDFFLATVQTPGNYALNPKSNSTYPLEFSVGTGNLLNYLSVRGYQINDPDWMEKVIVTVDGTISADIGIIKLNNQRIHFTDSLKKLTE